MKRPEYKVAKVYKTTKKGLVENESYALGIYRGNQCICYIPKYVENPEAIAFGIVKALEKADIVI
ncbi:MAG: hypothetical protein QXL18_01790 [Candidatus Woesearchaeota archaeon]